MSRYRKLRDQNTITHLVGQQVIGLERADDAALALRLADGSEVVFLACVKHDAGDVRPTLKADWQPVAS